MSYETLRARIEAAGYILQRGMWGTGIHASVTWEIRRDPRDIPTWVSYDFLEFSEKLDALHDCARKAEERWGIPIFELIPTIFVASRN
jgi:hypothetical protein